MGRQEGVRKTGKWKEPNVLKKKVLVRCYMFGREKRKNKERSNNEMRMYKRKRATDRSGSRQILIAEGKS